MSGEDGYSHSSSDYSDDSTDVEEQAQETIHRILQNDDTLSRLNMGGLRMDDNDDSGLFMSNNGSDISRLGSSIAKSTHLVKLAFHSSFYENAVFEIRDLIDGLEQNSSITELEISCTGHITRPSQAILDVYRKKRCLTLLSIDSANLHAATLPLCEMLRVSTNLRSINLDACNISDEQLTSIIEATRGGII